jgi:hypothetical protein
MRFNFVGFQFCKIITHQLGPQRKRSLTSGYVLTIQSSRLAILRLVVQLIVGIFALRILLCPSAVRSRNAHLVLVHEYN